MNLRHLWIQLLVSSCVLGLFSPRAEAQVTNLTELELYQRCYIRLVRQVPDTLDARYQAVKGGTKKASDACLELFDLAAFSTSGVLAHPDDPVARRVLKTFNDLHMSWFSNKLLISRTTALIHDFEEPALYFTRAAFLPNTKFNSVVTLPSGLKGVRKQASATPLTNFSAQNLVRYPSGFPYSNEDDLVVSSVQFAVNGGKIVGADPNLTAARPADADLVPAGVLIGVQPSVPFRNGKFLVIPPSGDTAEKAEMTRAFSAILPTLDADFNQHFGGGIIGSQTFLSFNANLGNGIFPDTVASINRRTTSKVFSDLLCHQLPTLTDADVASEIDASSPFTFKQQTTCMRCHSSIDGAGYTLRNLVLNRTSAAADQDRQTVGNPVTIFQALPLLSGAQTFALQPPTGTLHYRENLTGKMHSSNLTSIADFGNQLSTSPDLYLCAAKRYYKFLTGVDVDVTQAATKDLDIYHQNFVKTVAAKLMQSNSTRDVIKAIVESPQFKARNYKATKDAP